MPSILIDELNEGPAVLHALCSICGQETIANAAWQQGDLLCSNCADVRDGSRFPWSRFIADPISLAGYPLRREGDGLRWPERVSRSWWAVEAWNRNRELPWTTGTWDGLRTPTWFREQLEKNGDSLPPDLHAELRSLWGFLWGIVRKHWFHKYKKESKTRFFFDDMRIRWDKEKELWRPASVVPSNRRFKGPLRDYARAYNGASCDNVTDGPIAWPKRHGIKGWIRNRNKPPAGQDIKLRFVTQHGPICNEKGEHVGSQVFTYRDVIKTKLHRDEILELEKGRHLKVKGNTGGWRPLRADEDFMPWAETDGSVDKRVMIEAPSVEYTLADTLAQTKTERQAEAFLVQAMQKERSDVTFDGEEFAFAEDDRTEYFPCQIEQRGRDRNKTDDERFEKQVKKDKKWHERTQPFAQAIIKSGVCEPSPETKPEDIVMRDGIKIDTSSTTWKHIVYEVALNKGDYDTKKELGGKHYESFRKKELEEYIMPEVPTTKLTREQAEDIAKGGVYAHIVLDRGRWFKLDMNRHSNYRAAIHEIWSKSIDEAFKKSKVPSRRTDLRTPESHPELAQAFKEVVFRYEKAFRPGNIYIMDGRTPTVVAIAEAAWEDRNAH